jgi:hypothetical protein
MTPVDLDPAAIGSVVSRRQRLLALGRSADNKTFQLLAHRALGTTSMLHGDLTAAAEHHITGLKATTPRVAAYVAR